MSSGSAEHRYSYAVDLGDENDAAANVVRLVGQNKTVLEIGSGPGSITRYLKDPGECRIVAIEIDPAAAALVAPYCESVLRSDLNDPDWTQQLASYAGGFDVIVAADVLEHLYDPWRVLGQMRGLLNSDGYVVVSLPHAGHNSVIASLLNADVEYRESGLLDRTHIRFFGLRNMQSLFDDAGYRILDVKFVTRHPGATELAHQWLALPASLQGALVADRYGAVYQVVIKAEAATDGRKGIDLRTLAVPAVRDSWIQRRIVPRARGMANHLSPKSRMRLKTWLMKTGLLRKLRGGR
jgi:2-polyprenyl-3-methyl-5-hydroxy-6-metoxy-1,4-benzoquinol methylase